MRERHDALVESFRRDPLTPLANSIRTVRRPPRRVEVSRGKKRDQQPGKLLALWIGQGREWGYVERAGGSGPTCCSLRSTGAWRVPIGPSDHLDWRKRL